MVILKRHASIVTQTCDLFCICFYNLFYILKVIVILLCSSLSLILQLSLQCTYEPKGKSCDN